MPVLFIFMKYEIIPFNEKYIHSLFELIRQTVMEEYSEFYTSNVIDYFLSYNQPDDILTDAQEGYTALCFIDNLSFG